MSDIELVIKIPEEYYKAIMKIPASQSTADMLIIKNGIPLENQKTGHWEETDLYIYECSECHIGTSVGSKDNYCPNCGAKMKGE